MSQDLVTYMFLCRKCLVDHNDNVDCVCVCVCVGIPYVYMYIILQGVWLASLAHSLLVHAFHLYILHGRLLLVLLYSMSKLNNNGSKARYSNRPSLIINLVI